MNRFEQNARVAEARQQLERDVIAFLSEMKAGGESRLGRTPNSEDLLPYFERYASSVLYTKHKAAILDAPTLAEARRRAIDAVETVVTAICRRRRKEGERITQPAGLWQRTAKLAADAVNLGVWETQFGTYTRDVFMHPPRRQLKARLLVHTHTLLQEYLRVRAKESTSTHGNPTELQAEINPQFPIIPQFPIRAQWVREQMDVRDWNASDLSEHGGRGPDRKTIRRVLNGEAVGDIALKSVLRALNNFRTRRLPTLHRSDIPDK